MANVAIFAGIPFFVANLYFADARDRTALSLATFNAYQNGGGDAARERVVRPLWAYPQVFVRTEIGRVEYTRFLRLLAERDPSIVIDLSTVDYWMRVARGCEDEGGCDPDVNSRLFGAIAQGVHCVYRPMYEEWGRLHAIPEFGAHIAYYSVADEC